MHGMNEDEQREHDRIWAGTNGVDVRSSTRGGARHGGGKAKNTAAAQVVTVVAQVLWLPVPWIAWFAGCLAAFSMTGGEFGFWGEPGEDPGVLFLPLVAALAVVCGAALPAPYFVYRRWANG